MTKEEFLKRLDEAKHKTGLKDELDLLIEAVSFLLHCKQVDELQVEFIRNPLKFMIDAMRFKEPPASGEMPKKD